MAEFILAAGARRSLLLAGLSLSALLMIAAPVSLHHGFDLSASQAWADSGERGGDNNGGSGHEGGDDHDNGGSGSANSGPGHDGEDDHGGANGGGDDGPDHDVGDDRGDDDGGNAGANDDGTPDQGRGDVPPTQADDRAPGQGTSDN